jgi:hypothetical protein
MVVELFPYVVGYTQFFCYFSYCYFFEISVFRVYSMAEGGSTMTIKELYIKANETEQKVVSQIADDQWGLAMPENITHEPMTLEEVVRYHIWDDAWIPDVLAGKTKEEVGDVHEHLLKLTTKELQTNFTKYNQRAIAAVRDLSDLDRTVHLAYGDFPAREYLQHNVSVRAFWSYDIARLIGADTATADGYVQALMDEFSPVVEGYRQMGLFPPAIEVANDASPQTKLMAMVGRE